MNKKYWKKKAKAQRTVIELWEKWGTSVAQGKPKLNPTELDPNTALVVVWINGAPDIREAP
jgi:hypothetical protein